MAEEDKDENIDEKEEGGSPKSIGISKEILGNKVDIQGGSEPSFCLAFLSYLRLGILLYRTVVSQKRFCITILNIHFRR